MPLRDIGFGAGVVRGINFYVILGRGGPAIYGDGGLVRAGVIITRQVELIVVGV